MGAADMAADLLLCTDPHRAEHLARELCALNRERQAVEQEIYSQAVEQIEETPPQEPDFQAIHDALLHLAEAQGLKNGRIMWPVRVAVSGKATTTGGAVELCPAPITDAAWKQVGEMALKLHKGLGLSVYSRSDFILDENGQAWCLEINTLPGMTPTSLVPQEAAQVGLNYGELCEKIVELSLAVRKAARA